MISRPLCLLRVLQDGGVLCGLALLGAMGIGSAGAATITISTATTTALTTATVDAGNPGDISITGAGSITLTSGTAVTLNSNNTITQGGTIKFNDADNTNGIAILPGFTGTVTSTGTITLGDANTDAAIVHPNFANNKRGIILNSGGTFTGDIINSGTTTVFGDTSVGIDLQGTLAGNLNSSGVVRIQGDDSIGIRVAAPLNGNLTNGTMSVVGKNSSGILVLAPISGALKQNGTLNITAYDDTLPDAATDPANDNPTQILQQPGPGIGVGASIGAGILINGPSAAITSTPVAVIAGAASSNAIMISPRVPGATAGNIDIGLVGATGDDAYGVINRGTITMTPLYDTVSSESVLIEGWNNGVTSFQTIIAGGMRNEGSISSQSSNAGATGVRIGNLATVPTLFNKGTIQVGSTGNATFTTTAILLDAGANAGTLINSGSITANVNGNTASAYAIRDLSGSLTTITNTGFIVASVNAVDDPSTPAAEVATGSKIAADFSATSNPITFTNDLPPSWDPASNPNAAHIIGDVRFGSGNDQFLVNAGLVSGDIAFGNGADTLAINGGAVVQGALTDSDGLLTLNVSNGKLAAAAGTLGITTASFGAQGIYAPSVDTSAGTFTQLNASGTVTFASGAVVSPVLSGAFVNSLTATIITSPDIQIAGTPSSLLSAAVPFVYIADLTETTAAGIDSLNLVLTRKTSQQLGIADKLAPALDPLLRSMPLDTLVEEQFLGVTTQSQFDQAYLEFLPSYTDAMLAMAKRSSQGSSRQIRDRMQDLLLGHRGGGAWASETLYQLSRKSETAARGYDAQGSVLSFGIDDYVTRDIVLGLTFGLDHGSNTENGDSDQPVSVRRWTGGIYGGMRFGALMVSGSVNGALVDQSVNRIVILGNQGRFITADWRGSKYAADIGASYLAPFGKWYIKPGAGVNYLRVFDDGYTESGSQAFGLEVASRSADSIEPYVEVVIGRNFNAMQSIVPFEPGQPFVLSPELRLGWSYDLISDPVDLRARYIGDPLHEWFTIPSDERDQTAFTAGLGFKFVTAYGTIGADVNGVMGDNTKAFVGRLNASFRF